MNSFDEWWANETAGQDLSVQIMRGKAKAAWEAAIASERQRIHLAIKDKLINYYSINAPLALSEKDLDVILKTP